MSDQTYLSEETPCSFNIGNQIKTTLEVQLNLSGVTADPEIYHCLGWFSYFRYCKKNIVIELLEITRTVSVCNLLISLSRKGYRPAVLQELLFLVQRKSPRGLPDTIVLPTLNWSKLKREEKYILLKWKKSGWHIGGIDSRVALKPGWRIACVKIWD